MSIVLDEPTADDCIGVLESEQNVLISAGTLAEALIVSSRRRVGEEMIRLVDDFGFDIVPITHRTALQVGAAYAKWGKGKHAANLNLGDCFAYVVARESNCPLLFLGGDFSRTDIISVL
jgi:ribonuclease VapC